jgi:hypothetical protein
LGLKFYWNRSVAGRVSADFVEGRILALDELIALCNLTVQEYGPVPRHRTEVAGTEESSHAANQVLGPNEGRRASSAQLCLHI